MSSNLVRFWLEMERVYGGKPVMPPEQRAHRLDSRMEPNRVAHKEAIQGSAENNLSVKEGLLLAGSVST